MNSVLLNSTPKFPILFLRFDNRQHLNQTLDVIKLFENLIIAALRSSDGALVKRLFGFNLVRILLRRSYIFFS